MPSSWCLPLPPTGCGDGAVKPSLGCLPWWKTTGAGGSGGAPLNKLVLAPWRANLKLFSPLPSYHGDGGVGDEENTLDLPDPGVLRVMQSGVLPVLSPLCLLWLRTGSGCGVTKLPSGALPWWTASWEGGSTGKCLNKPGCSSDMQDLVAQPPMRSHHGDGVVGCAWIWPGLRSGLQGDGAAGVAVPRRSSGSAIHFPEQEFLSNYSCTSCICLYLSDDLHVEDAVSKLFGLCHRRWTTTPPLLILRFNSRDALGLSSVKPFRYL